MRYVPPYNPLIRHRTTCAFYRAIALVSLASSAVAQPSSTNAPPDLSLEQLINIKVTSVSKKEENLSDSAAAITVLSNDDLHRSGATSVAEALRLVPGMDVAQINSSTWAISVRGFDEVYSRSVLALSDGRTIFLPFNGGVLWDLQQQMLPDLDRIEVIRGPGGTLWGANAVNGVINIVSKSARDTQGTLLYGGGGDVHTTMEGARYGDKLNDDTYYRVFGSYQKTADFDAPGGGKAGAGYQGGMGGFRLDHYTDEQAQLTWQGDATYNDLLNGTARDYNLNTLGRWTRTFSDRSSLMLQTYADRTESSAWGGVDMATTTYDVSAQQNIGLGQHNDLVCGFGARWWDVHLSPLTTPSLVLAPYFSEQRVNIFAQDQFNVVPDKLTLTAGIKLEYDSITDFEYEPSARAMFKPADSQTLWAAVSRSVLIPTLKAGYNGYLQPDNIGSTNTYDYGNPRIKSADVLTCELGYRIQLVKRISLDTSGYYNHYANLQNQVQTGNVYTWENAFDAQTYGGEVSVTVMPVDEARVTAFYSLMKIVEWGPMPDTDVLHGSPEQQAGVRCSYDFTRRISSDGQLRYVDSVAGAKSYITADLQLTYRPINKVELALVGQNLFEPAHVELAAGQAREVGEVPRGVYAKVTCQF